MKHTKNNNSNIAMLITSIVHSVNKPTCLLHNTFFAFFTNTYKKKINLSFKTH